MDSSVLDTYELLFNAARQDMRLTEKQANIIGDGINAARRFINSTRPAQAINHSRLGLLVDPPAATVGGLSGAGKRLEEGLGNAGIAQAVGLGNVGRASQHIDELGNLVVQQRKNLDDIHHGTADARRALDAADKEYEDAFMRDLMGGMSPEQRQWVNRASQPGYTGPATRAEEVAQRNAASHSAQPAAQQAGARAEQAQQAAQQTTETTRAPQQAAPQGTEHAAVPRRVEPSQAAPQAEQAGPGRRGWGTALGVGAVGGTGAGGYYYGQHKAEEDARRNRNLAFGSGMAVGATAPAVFKGIHDRFGPLFGSSSAGPAPGTGYGR